MNQFSALEPKKHSQIKLNSGIDIQAISQLNQTAITVEEFVPSSSSYPVFFLKNSQIGNFSSAALMGFKPTENLFVGQDTETLTKVAYLPNTLTLLPFSLVNDPEDQSKLTIGVNESSQLIEQGSVVDGDDCYALFEGEDNMTPSVQLQKIEQYLMAYYQAEMTTQQFIAELNKHQLIQELEITLTFADEQTETLRGLYTINEESLNQLDDEIKLQFLQQGFYPPIHAMLASITQINRMIQLHQKQEIENPVANVNMKIVA